ncbi:MAG TPA: hypothetical protein VGP26_10840 [Actinophytocola sp.]|jgi:hypothetical protein|nr:hypothetical protein [Actinophytocola sp.]
MSHQTQPESAGLNRRKVILTGAGVAAAGVVVGAGVPIVSSRLAGGDAEAGEPVAAPDKPVMVHLRDAGAGHFDVFVGTERAQVTDRGFASRLARAVAEIEGR